MLHQSTAHSEHAHPPGLDAEGRPIFPVTAYIDAMRAAGAALHPARGEPSDIDLNGTFTVELPLSALARRRLTAIEDTFAARRAADPLAEGRIAQALLIDDAKRRLAALVRDDFAAALVEIARLEDVLSEAYDRELATDDLDSDDPIQRDAMLAERRAADLASEAYQLAVDHVLVMPIRRKKDLGLKAEFALRYCDSEVERAKVLTEIAIFCSPERAGTLPKIRPIAP